MIFFLICIFMILVFIEIIPLDFCGLSNMTRKNVEIRARLDSILNDNNDAKEELEEEIKEVIEDNDKDK